MTTLEDRKHVELDPSPWVLRFAKLLANGGRVLDVACGAGRHARALASLGYEVEAVDRDVSRFVEVPASVCVLQADIEIGPWPYENKKFAGVVVTNYLYRPLLAKLVSCVAPGGVFIYETFSLGNELFGRPSRAEFLLKPGELLETVRGHLRVVAFEDTVVDVPKPARVQRIAAIRDHAE